MTAIDEKLAEAAAVVHYGVAASARSLPGEFDRNFELIEPDGTAYVLKFTHPQTADEQLEFENAILGHLAGLPVPRLVTVRGGGQIARTPSGLRVRLFTKLPGLVLDELRPYPEHVVGSLGGLLGRVDRALAGFEHPAMRRDWMWDLARAAEQIEPVLPELRGERQALVAHWLDRFKREVAPRLPDLPHQLIHNDANGMNVLVIEQDGGMEISGIVDFGDALYAPRVCEPAIAAAYAIFGVADPAATAGLLLEGYQAANPLTSAELAVFWDLIGTRLAVSVCIAARRAGTGNAYHQVSAAGAWEALDRLASRRSFS